MPSTVQWHIHEHTEQIGLTRPYDLSGVKHMWSRIGRCPPRGHDFMSWSAPQAEEGKWEAARAEEDAITEEGWQAREDWLLSIASDGLDLNPPNLRIPALSVYKICRTWCIRNKHGYTSMIHASASCDLGLCLSSHACTTSRIHICSSTAQPQYGSCENNAVQRHLVHGVVANEAFIETFYGLTLIWGAKRNISHSSHMIILL